MGIPATLSYFRFPALKGRVGGCLPSGDNVWQPPGPTWGRQCFQRFPSPRLWKYFNQKIPPPETGEPVHRQVQGNGQQELGIAMKRRHQSPVRLWVGSQIASASRCHSQVGRRAGRKNYRCSTERSLKSRRHRPSSGRSGTGGCGGAVGRLTWCNEEEVAGKRDGEVYFG